MPVSFDQNCLHLTFKPYLSSESDSHKNEKLSNTQNKENYGKTTMLKKCGPQIRLCLIMF